MKTTVKKLLTLTLLATLGTNLIQAMPPKKKTQAKASNKNLKKVAWLRQLHG